MKTNNNQRRWMAAAAGFIIHCSLFISPVGAQTTFTQRIQQDVQGAGKVTLHQDAAIDELVNGTNTTRTQPATPPRQNNNNRTRRQDGDNTATRTDTADGNVVNELATDTIEVERRTRQMMGWRIQAYVGGKTRTDRQRAERTGSELRSLFPGQKVYVHFYPPRWTCRMGNFRTQEEAREMLDEVVRMGYDTATMVREKITVPY